MKKLLLWSVGAAVVLAALVIARLFWLSPPGAPALANTDAVAAPAPVPAPSGDEPEELVPNLGPYAAPDRRTPSPPAVTARPWAEPFVPALADGEAPLRRAAAERDMVVGPAAKMYVLRSPRPFQARGIYLTAATAAGRRFDELLALVERTELNAMVIDIKSDWGTLTYRSQLPDAIAAKAVDNTIKDLPELVRRLRERGVYPIARLVTFKDDYMPRHRTDLAVHHVDGGVWQDRKGMAWLNPYRQETWDYIVDVAKEAAEMGFQEIQFDYVRFPTDGNVRAIVYPDQDERSRWDVISQFLAYAREELRPYGVLISADIFGFILSAQNDQGIGQLLEDLATNVDIISPMVYPSHWGPGNLGLPNPNAAPYETVLRSMQQAQERLDKAGIKVKIRPWLQDFTLGQPRYGAHEVRRQIEGAYAAGLDEWLLWNAGNYYTEGALLPAG